MPIADLEVNELGLVSEAAHDLARAIELMTHSLSLLAQGHVYPREVRDAIQRAEWAIRAMERERHRRSEQSAKQTSAKDAETL